MKNAAFIAGDWTTSHLTLFVCDQDGNVLRQGQGPGIADMNSRIEALGALNWHTLFNSLVADPDASQLPVVLCGMVGSPLGWHAVPNVPCPQQVDRLAETITRVPDTSGRAIGIVSGVTCTNRNNAPDLMRSGETRILGATRLLPALTSGAHLICLPGTQTKWALLDDNVLLEFTTAATGELFDVLVKHSVLIQGTVIEPDREQFMRGLDVIHKRYGLLLQLMFECRSRQLVGELSAEEAAGYLSGLLVGADVMAAIRSYPTLSVTIIGAPATAERYAIACRQFGIPVEVLSTDAAAQAGLFACYQQLVR